MKIQARILAALDAELEAAYPSEAWSYLIVALAQGKAVASTCWRLAASQDIFVAETIEQV